MLEEKTRVGYWPVRLEAPANIRTTNYWAWSVLTVLGIFLVYWCYHYLQTQAWSVGELAWRLIVAFLVMLAIGIPDMIWVRHNTFIAWLCWMPPYGLLVIQLALLRLMADQGIVNILNFGFAVAAD